MHHPEECIDDMVQGYLPSSSELTEILNGGPEVTQHLFTRANDVRIANCGDTVHMRAIIEFSNVCRCECLYCGLRARNRHIERYRMSVDEILTVADEAYRAGYRTIVLQSGEDLWYTRDRVSAIIRGIKRIGDIAITLSIGERDVLDYQQWFRDGADRFLMKHETASERLYRQLHPKSTLAERVKALRTLQDIGYQIGSGFMIGLPNQQTYIIAEDILLLHKLGVDMAGIGPFLPNPDTPLCHEQAGSEEMTLKALAVTRILLPYVHLPATTALLTKRESALEQAFAVGANVLMLKVQPHGLRALYEIYPRPVRQERSVSEDRKVYECFFAQMGRRVARDRGDMLKRGGVGL